MSKRFFHVLPFVSLLACADPSGDSASGDIPSADSAGAAALTAADVAGRWASPACEAYDDGKGGHNYLTRDFQLTGSAWHLDLGVFGDEGCSYPLFSATIDGTFTLDGPSSVVSGGTDGEFRFDSIVWTAQDAGVAKWFTASGCGAEPWEVGVPQDVGTTGCVGVAHPIAECPQEYDVVGLVGGDLYFGERVTDMCTASGRPAAFSPYGLAAR
jgi:hypothetical protein